ncbi:MAG TPA: hypothetical protein VK540_34395 [Polyangiaceae bacterium]|nr:hypothetical protein [Polyangiaceae bacterium]
MLQSGVIADLMGIASGAVLSNQQHRTTILNSAIQEDMLQPPFIITKVFVTR